MPRVKLPAASLAASGTFGRVLTFVSGDRGPIVRAALPSRRTFTASQVGVQAMNRFLTSQWVNCNAAARQTWQVLATSNRTTPYHAYLGYNMQRWNNYRMPSQVFPATEVRSFSPPTGTTLEALRQGVRIVETPPTPKLNWGTVFLYKFGGYSDVTWKAAVRVEYLPALVPITIYWDHSPLGIGMHYYRITNFSTDGKKSGTFSAGFKLLT